MFFDWNWVIIFTVFALWILCFLFTWLGWFILPPWTVSCCSSISMLKCECLSTLSEWGLDYDVFFGLSYSLKLPLEISPVFCVFLVYTSGYCSSWRKSLRFMLCFFFASKKLFFSCCWRMKTWFSSFCDDDCCCCRSMSFSRRILYCELRKN